MKTRLNKVLASSGVASRRKCEELIFAGKVTINGKVVLLPQTMVEVNDRVCVGGKLLRKEDKKVYFILNKPSGYLCSSIRTSLRAKIILDLFKEIPLRLFTVGRLDKETKGLLLVTNDGNFANQVIHPSSGVVKEYVAKTSHEITPEHLEKIRQGTIVEGIFVKPLKVFKVRRGTIKVSVGEGKKREVRLLLENAGLTVKELTRIRIGNLKLGTLLPGQWRELTEKERELIFQ